MRHEDVILASWIATSMHHGQVDKIGEPYIMHPARVAQACHSAGLPNKAVVVGWLHDTVEDTPMTTEILGKLFTKEVADAVDAISKRKGESFESYYERVKANPLALAVKWHDIADNADPRRLAKVAPDTRDRLRDKYERAVIILRGPEQ